MILYLIWAPSPKTGSPALQGWKRRRKAAESYIKAHPGTYVEAFDYPGDHVPPFEEFLRDVRDREVGSWIDRLVDDLRASGDLVSATNP